MRREAFWTRHMCHVAVRLCPGPLLLAFPKGHRLPPTWRTAQPGHHSGDSLLPRAALPGTPGATARAGAGLGVPSLPDLHHRAASAPWPQPALHFCHAGCGLDQEVVSRAGRAGSERAVWHWPCSACEGLGHAGTGLPATVRAAQSPGDSAYGSLLRKRGCTLCSVNAKPVARLCGTVKNVGAGVDTLCIQGWADCPRPPVTDHYMTKPPVDSPVSPARRRVRRAGR